MRIYEVTKYLVGLIHIVWCILFPSKYPFAKNNTATESRFTVLCTYNIQSVAQMYVPVFFLFLTQYFYYFKYLCFLNFSCEQHACKLSEIIKMNIKAINQVWIRELKSKRKSSLLPFFSSPNRNILRSYTRIHGERLN